MNRRNFLKMIGASTSAFAVTPLGRRVISTLAAAQNTAPIVTQVLNGLTPTPAPTGMVPAPSGGLGSNHNYFLDSDCNPITGLSIVLDVTKDIISDIGFGIQLNAYSPLDANATWQQYTLAFYTSGTSPLKVNVGVDNWPSTSFLQAQGLPAHSDLINYNRDMLTLPGPTMPAGSKITISLKYDNKNNVTGATYSVVDNKGKVSSTDIALDTLKIKRATPPKPVTSEDFAPINSFQLNIVGPTNGLRSYLTSGAGTITYTATSPLTVLSQDPQCTSAKGIFTAEAANTIYGALPAGPSRTIKQSFDIEIPPPYATGMAFAVSQQFGVDQTDLFAVNSIGQLAVFYTQEQGHWQSLKPIGPAGFAIPGAKVAASQHFGVDKRTDVFLIGQNGQLNVFWVIGSGDWHGPDPVESENFIAPSGTVPAASQHFGVTDRTDVYMVDKNGQLNVYWAVGSGDWKGPDLVGATGFAQKNAVVAASQHFGVDKQTDVFVVDLTGQLNVFSAVGSGNWSGPQSIGPAGFTRSGASMAASRRFGTNDQTDVFVVDTKGQLNVFSAVGSGAWSGPQAIGPTGFAHAGVTVAASQHLGANSQTDVFLMDTKGQLNVFSIKNGGQWSDPLALSPQNTELSGAVVVASSQFGVKNQTDVFFFNPTGTAGEGWPTVVWAEGANAWNSPKALVNEI